MTVAVDPAAVARGRVVDLESGVGIEGVRLRTQVSGRWLVTHSGRDGAFELRGFLPGEAAPIDVRAPDSFVPETIEAEVAPASPAIDLGIVRLLKAADWPRRAQGGGVHGVRASRCPTGLCIGRVRAGSPAARAGLAPGDLLLGLDGSDLRLVGPGAFHHRAARPPGSLLALIVQPVRGERRSLSLTVEAPCAPR